MTEKLGKWTLASLVIDDRRPGQRFSVGPYNTRAVDGVVRVTREFGNQSYIGGFFFRPDFVGTNNLVGSPGTRPEFFTKSRLAFHGGNSPTRHTLNRLT